MKITILVDNPSSWFIPHAKGLRESLRKEGHAVFLAHSYSQIKRGDCLFLLSCERIVGRDILQLNKHNIVIHGSKLPQGRGFAPLIWQVLEGKKKIWFTLFEATEKVDSGNIYLEDHIILEGHELHDELREKQANKVIEMALKFIAKYPNFVSRVQRGTSSWYRRRTWRDGELDINKSIKEAFNNLRVADNGRYPAFFKYRGHKYIIKIYKAD